METLKIGLILPNSNYIPQLGKSIKNAFRLAFESEANFNYQLFIESGGFNESAKNLADKAQKLILNEDINILVAPLNSSMGEGLKTICDDNKVPLIALTMGADPWYTYCQSPYLFVNSFNSWQSSWMTGNWAVKNIGNKGCSLMSFHEGGYALTSAFDDGMKSYGGSLHSLDVTHRNSRSENCQQEISSILNSQPDFLYAQYSGDEAVSFIKDYKVFEKNIPLITSQFMFEEKTISEYSNLQVLDQTRFFSSWNRISKQSKDVLEQFESKYRMQMNPYAVLAYEAGLLLISACSVLDYFEGPEFVNQISKASVNSIRGEIKFQSDNTVVTPTQYLMRTKLENGELQFICEEEVEIPLDCINRLKYQQKNSRKQGWLNPYLCG